MNNNNKNRAALYCRLSKEDIDKINKGDDSASIINQRMLLEDYATNKGFSIYKVYQDDDYSGLFDDRPGFESMIEDAKKGKFDIIIAKTQSRFTRNMEHMEHYLHDVFPSLGIRFIGVVDNADTKNKGNKKARQINGLI
ncbi:MAG: recombinase family protein, partial [Candidatus Ornithomonoglobus sp.]